MFLMANSRYKIGCPVYMLRHDKLCWHGEAASAKNYKLFWHAIDGLPNKKLARRYSSSLGRAAARHGILYINCVLFCIVGDSLSYTMAQLWK